MMPVGCGNYGSSVDPVNHAKRSRRSQGQKAKQPPISANAARMYVGMVHISGYQRVDDTAFGQAGLHHQPTP